MVGLFMNGLKKYGAMIAPPSIKSFGKMNKERKSKWEISHVIKDAAWHMIENIRDQVKENKEGYMISSKMVVSGSEIELILTRSDVTMSEDISTLSCLYEKRTPYYITSRNIINRGTWDDMKKWLMGSHCIDEVAKTLDYQEKHATYWD